MATTLSPVRRLARTLANLVTNDRVDGNSAVSRILEVLKQYLDDFDDQWTAMEQQDHLDKCQNEILTVLQKASMSTVNINVIQQEVDEAFDEVSRSLESMDSIGLPDFSLLTSALADLRQSMIKIISRLTSELNIVTADVTSLKSDMSVLQNKFIHLEEESDNMKKMHLISDLFGPFMSKVYSLMSLENLSASVLTRKKLEQIRQHMRNEIESNDDTNSNAIASIVKNVADEFQVNPSIAIHYCLKKKIRNDAVHFNRKIQSYATSTSPNQRSFATFLTLEPDLEYQFFDTEVQSLDGLFRCLCNQMTLSHQSL